MSTLEARQVLDPRIVVSTVTHRRVWPFVTDDACPDRSQFEPSPHMTYLGMYKGPEYLGLFALHPHNAICWEAHTCLLPAAWGPLAVACAKLCIEWVFTNTDCRRLIGSVPEGYTLAERLAEAAGMVRYGTNPRSFLKNGRELDLIMLGISKGAPWA